jgi:hypothetical protein
MSYQYQALAKGQIRLLRFTATGLDGFTRIELETHALTDNLRSLRFRTAGKQL